MVSVSQGDVAEMIKCGSHQQMSVVHVLCIFTDLMLGFGHVAVKCCMCRQKNTLHCCKT